MTDQNSNQGNMGSGVNPQDPQNNQQEIKTINDEVLTPPPTMGDQGQMGGGMPTPPPSMGGQWPMGGGMPTPPPTMGNQGQMGGMPTPPPTMGGQWPMGGGMPTPPPTMGGQWPMGGGMPTPPRQEEDKTPANFQLGKLFTNRLNVPVGEHILNFDEQRFINLLAGSISLSKAEKKRIIDSIPKLKQEQIDELIRIFEEERFKFSQLSKKHVPQLEKLAIQHHADWVSLEDDYNHANVQKEDDAKAAEIRKNLGL